MYRVTICQGTRSARRRAARAEHGRRGAACQADGDPGRFTREVEERRKREALVVDALNEIADAMDQKVEALEAGDVDAA